MTLSNPKTLDLRRPRHALATAATIALMLFHEPADAAVALLTVGDDPACDYRTSLLPNALQAAVDAVPLSVPPTDLYVIRVARSGNYAATTIDSFDRDYLMEGGYETCDAVSPVADNTVIDAAGANRSVFRVLNTTERKRITLANLTLSGARGTGATGLLIDNADVELRRVRLHDNRGGIRGGGARLEGGGLGASLSVGDGSSITANAVLQEGGGIYCGGGARLELETESAVSGNEASEGGGLYIDGCSGYANSGATGLGGLFVNIGSNTASFGGGGIYLDSALGPTSFVIGEALGPDDPRPILVLNEAAVQGGAIMAVGGDTTLALRNALVLSNTSGGLGGGIQVRNGARVLMEQTLRRCGTSTECSSLVDNTANTGGALSVGGAGSELTVRRTRISGNTANQGSALFNQSGNAFALLENVLMDDNDGDSVVYASSPTSGPPLATTTDIVASTIADNTGLSRVLDLNDEGEAYIGLTIINAASGVPSLSHGPGNVPETECGVFHEAGSVVSPGAFMAFTPVPGFVDAAADDYRLGPTAFAVDRCPMIASYPNDDIELNPRPYDMPFANLDGPVDVGAYEANQILFRDGFEGG